MQLESERLILRPWTQADAPHYEIMSKDIGYNGFATPGIYLAKDAADLRAKIQRRMDTFAQHGLSKFPIFRKSDGVFVGTCGADFFEWNGRQEIELGYRLLGAHWGQGYATEAARVVLHYLFHGVGATRVFGFAVAQNTASIKVLEKLGFQYLQPFSYAGVEHQLYQALRLTEL